ncbi:MAG: hypothetical protein JWQ02_1798 [Capsulimonas sp.]|nr:hypothetical protein [Capsulimonas sp.]
MTKKVTPQEDAFGTFATHSYVGTFLTIVGVLMLMLAGGLRPERGQYDSMLSTTCIMDGRSVDCRTYAPVNTPSPSSVADARVGVFLFGGLLLAGGMIAFLFVQSGKDELKRRMIDYANKRANQEGTAPDLSFLFYFDNAQRRSGMNGAEEKIARQSYARMLEWEKAGGSSATRAHRAASIAKIVCSACKTANDPDSQYCKKCGRPLAA